RSQSRYADLLPRTGNQCSGEVLQSLQTDLRLPSSGGRDATAKTPGSCRCRPNLSSAGKSSIRRGGKRSPWPQDRAVGLPERILTVEDEVGKQHGRLRAQ